MQPRNVAWSFFADFLALGLAFGLAFRLHFSDRLSGFGQVAAVPHHYVAAVAALIPAWLLVYALRGLYSTEVARHGTRLEVRVIDATTLAAVLTLAGLYLTGSVAYSRGWLVMAWAGATVLTIAGRRLMLTATRRRAAPWRVLVAGACKVGAQAVETLEDDRRYEVVGFLDDYLPLGTWVAGKQVVGRPADIATLTRSLQVDEILLVDGALGRDSYDGLLRELYTTPRLPAPRFIPGTSDALVAYWEVTKRGGLTVWSPTLGRIHGADRVAKAGLDRLVAAGVLVVASPLFLIAWAWSRRHGQPVLRGSPVVGHGGRRFLRWSFAAWWAADPALDGTLRYATLGANRAWAQLIRKVPRALNVLRGELSLVGPRPILQEDFDLYRNVLGVLLAMKPGLVGPWLLHGDSDLLPEEELAADLAYVRGYTLGSDLAVLAKSSRQLWRRLRRRRSRGAIEPPLPRASDGRTDVRQQA